MTTHCILKATQEEAVYIDQQLGAFNGTQVPFTQAQTPMFLNYVIKDKDVIVAGINTCLYHWGMLYISELFVEEAFRGKRLGIQLLDYVEQEAISLGGLLSHCDTFDFQAKDFYLKYGYKIFGVLENCPPGHKRYYLSKAIG